MGNSLLILFKMSILYITSPELSRKIFRPDMQKNLAIRAIIWYHIPVFRTGQDAGPVPRKRSVRRRRALEDKNQMIRRK
ncbi:MAG: hypothetical protein HFF76_12285 [Oscillospiraceae bacterium]|nr:hypothetical protein [Oscillospiraceae bacterium]